MGNRGDTLDMKSGEKKDCKGYKEKSKWDRAGADVLLQKPKPAGDEDATWGKEQEREIKDRKETIADLSKERHSELNPPTQLNLSFFLPLDA